MARVELDHVSKTFRGPRGRDIVAVEDLSLRVEDRELLVLLGPSGCGKTTTLRLIAGLETPSSGTLRIGDRVVNDVEPADRDLAMVFQSPALFPHLTVARNLAFGLELRRLPREEIARRVRGVAAMLGLEQELDRLPSALSGGQRQRASLGRALARQPQAFLFDEPLSSLDAPLRLQLRQEIARLHARLHTTTLYVTHDQEEAMSLGQRLAVLHQGRLQQVDTPQAIYDRPANAFVAGFLGSPPMNLVRGRLAPGQSVWTFHPTFPESADLPWRVSIPVAAVNRWQVRPDQAVILGLRPEHLQISEHPLVAQGILRGQVDLVEPLGPVSNLMVRTGSLTLIARVNSPTSVRAGQELALTWDCSAPRWFDAGSGKALPPGED